MTTALTTKQQIQGFMRALDIKDAEVAAALPSTAQRLRAKTQLQMQLREQPKLLACANNGSLFNAFLKACMFNLEIGTECYIIPYGTMAVFQTDYKGLCKLARRHEEIEDIHAVVVYDCDEIEVTSGADGVQVDHKMNTFHEDYGKADHVLGAYATAFFVNGRTKTEVMNRHEIDQVRASSKAKDADAWVKWYTQMARKCPIRRLCKFLPQSLDLAEALDLENRADIGKAQFGDGDIIDIEADDPIPMPTEVDKPASKPRAKAKQKTIPEPEPEEIDLKKQVVAEINRINQTDMSAASEILDSYAMRHEFDGDIDKWDHTQLVGLLVELKKFGKEAPTRDQ